MKTFLKQLFLGLFVWCVAASSFAQTTINGGNLSGTLTLAGSPYLITEEVTVPEDSTLTIEPGVVMDFALWKNLSCFGTLISIGEKTEPIVFTYSGGPPKGWAGVFILGTKGQDTSLFKNCIFENTPTSGPSGTFRGVTIQSGGLLTYFSNIKVDSCTFKNLGNSIVGYSSSVSIADSKFLDTYPLDGRQIGRFDSCDLSVSNCLFDNTRGGFSIFAPSNLNAPNITDCIFKDGQGTLQIGGRAWVDNCTFLRNTRAAIRTYDFNGVISNCTFDSTSSPDLDGQNIAVIRGAYGAVVRNCVFKNTHQNGNPGAYDILGPNALPTLENCLFDNTMGVKSFGGPITVINSVFTNGRGGIEVDDATIVNCLFLNNNRDEVYDTSSYGLEYNNRSSATVNGGGTMNVYNSCFINNYNYSGDTVNMTEIGAGQTNLYNCIIIEGVNSFNKYQGSSNTFTGTYQDCIETTPMFSQEAGKEFEFSQTCSRVPSGFNLGYTQPIAGKYRGINVSDVLSEVMDANGHPRMWDDTVDIGPYETQYLDSRIDVDLQPQDVGICVGEGASFTAKARSGTLITQWQKSVDGGAFSNMGNMTEEVLLSEVQSADSGTQYRVSWANFCNDYLHSDTAILQVYTPTDIELGETVRLPRDSSATLTPGAGFKQYIWSTGATTASIEVDGMDLSKGTHTYTVEVENEQGCWSIDSVVVEVVQGAGIEELLGAIRVYPNPGSTHINVVGVQVQMLSLYTTSGQKLKQVSNQAVLDVNELPQGVYILRIDGVRATRFVKWVKE